MQSAHLVKGLEREALKRECAAELRLSQPRSELPTMWKRSLFGEEDALLEQDADVLDAKQAETFHVCFLPIWLVSCRDGTDVKFSTRILQKLQEHIHLPCVHTVR